MYIFSQLDLKENTLLSIAIISTIIGAIFIAFSGFIGDVVIRILSILTVIFLLGLLKMKYPFLNTLQKITIVISLIGCIVATIYPNWVFIIVGIALLYFSIINFYKVFKDKSSVNYLGIALSVIGLLFGIFCVIKSSSAKNIIIIILGIILVLIGCLSFYELFRKKTNK